jgi:hypothetical protein
MDFGKSGNSDFNWPDMDSMSLEDLKKELDE